MSLTSHVTYRCTAHPFQAWTWWPKGLACNNGPLHSKDRIPRESMVAATDTPCQGSPSVTDKGPWLSAPKEKKACTCAHWQYTD